jgi:hypothetical protein
MASEPARRGEGWEEYVGKVVVVDTDSNFLYLGTLERIEDHFIYLSSVDVHDRSETPSTKEKYIMEAKRFGVRANRKATAIRKIKIVSLALLDDVVEY